MQDILSREVVFDRLVEFVNLIGVNLVRGLKVDVHSLLLNVEGELSDVLSLVDSSLAQSPSQLNIESPHLHRFIY